tara:strand:+ start:5250 stop:6998 length:1749 start_codon:yes stop_codon:yes gene_type:complete
MEYSKLADLYKELESTSKRLAKTHIISEFIKKAKNEDLPTLMLLIQGRIFPHYDPREIGVASRLVLKSINIATGLSIPKIEEEWKKTGDLGIVTENLIKSKTQVTLQKTNLTIDKVFQNLRKLAELQGSGTVGRKTQLIAELLTSSTPLEARFITRTILSTMRIGIGEGTLRDSITWAFFQDKINIKFNKKEVKIEVEDRTIYNKYLDAVQRAYDLTNDFGPVAIAAKQGLSNLQQLKLKVGIPIKVMLAIKEETIEDAFKTVGKPAAIEFKMDGFRLQCHKSKDKITLFTRRLENVTAQFPEVVNYIKTNIKGSNFIIDSEAVGFSPKTKKYLPFQNISQRIKRKYDIDIIAKKFPVELNIFDIIFYEGKNLIDTPFKERRALLEKITKQEKNKIILATNIVTDKISIVESQFKKAINEGNEGLMIKSLDAPYKPGSRVGHMIKYKIAKESLDLVIIAAEWGEGKRSKWLSSFSVACVKEGKFLEIGKVSTGLKEKEEEGLSFKEMTKILKPLITEEIGKTVKVKPKIVIEVGYEEIQISQTYSSGFALRFPRVKNIRPDRSANESTSLTEVENFFDKQNK